MKAASAPGGPRDASAPGPGRRKDRTSMSDVLEADDALAALEAEVNAAAAVGMQPAVWARRQPDRVAIYDYTGQDRSFGALNANANRVARLIRQAGLKAGDAVALAC